MTQSDSLAAAFTAASDKANQRRDARRRDIVDHGLAMQQGANTMCAVEYLKSHGIPPAVIARVLLEPQRRRSFADH